MMHTSMQLQSSTGFQSSVLTRILIGQKKEEWNLRIFSIDASWYEEVTGNEREDTG